MIAGLGLASAAHPERLLAISTPPDREDAVTAIHSVTGPIAPSDLGLTLVHEHIMCDFIGADKTGPHRWQRDEVTEVMLPYLAALRDAGARTFVDCSPKFIGRDPLLLQGLSRASGLRIITNTGLYKEPFLPASINQESADSLADDWTREATHGIDTTGIRPGFIKIAANPAPLLPVQETITRAAARTHLRTGLTIASHTTDGPTALRQLDILSHEKVAPSAFIWVHADAEEDSAFRLEAGKRGAWIELDAIDAARPERHLAMIRELIAAGLQDRVLLSQDAGWYAVGEPRGGAPRPYHPLLTDFVPALRRSGLPDEAATALLTTNPSRALTPTVKAV